MVSKQFIKREVGLRDEVETLRKKLSTDKKLKKAEVPIPEKPTAHFKTFPENLSEIPSSELGNYLGVYEAEAAYIRHLVSMKEEEVALSDVLLDYLFNSIIEKAPSQKPSEAKSYAKSHPYFLEARMEKIEIESELSRLKSSLEACISYSRAISREITNRRSETAFSGRANMIVEG